MQLDASPVVGFFLRNPFFELTKGPPVKTGADWKRKMDIGLGSPTKVLGGERVCNKSYSGGSEWIDCERFGDKFRPVITVS